jgi:hypothetical protein
MGAYFPAHLDFVSQGFAMEKGKTGFQGALRVAPLGGL